MWPNLDVADLSYKGSKHKKPRPWFTDQLVHLNFVAETGPQPLRAGSSESSVTHMVTLRACLPHLLWSCAQEPAAWWVCAHSFQRQQKCREVEEVLKRLSNTNISIKNERLIAASTKNRKTLEKAIHWVPPVHKRVILVESFTQN